LSYAGTRDSEQLRILDVAIAEFIQRYTSNPAAVGRRTIFLFPGGMGCQLLRARTPYQNAVAAPQAFQYDKVWLTVGTFLGDALRLGMHHDPLDPPGVERDLDDRIIIADGAVELFGITPYDRFTQWCELNGLDWFIFGWDWRRRLEDTVSLFLTQFLQRFRSAVQNACGADPLNDFVLVGHSFGGMIVNLILHQANSLLDTMTRAITVAAPFYGYDGQIHRWFEGVEYFNLLGKTAVIRVISSMPACYTLPYLDENTYNLYQQQLRGDPDPLFRLVEYPSRDAGNPAQIADPFNPVGQRYPGNTGFDMNLLNDGLQIFRQLALPPLPRHAGKFFNIRGAQFVNNAVTQNTVGSITWQLLPGVNNPNASPIQDHPPPGSGDDTQPAWSTRHAALPNAQSITVRDAIDHMFMMEYAATQAAIAGVL
jgi:hypothetical protein